jgi:hypothetical protein
MTWERARGTIGVLISGGGIVVGLTVLFLGMRAVMDIGGSCGAAGTPSCPGHVGGLVPAAIWGGLIFAGLYLWQCMKHHVPSFVSLLWPALFLSLGYNFFDYAFRNSTVAAGFLVCGIVFGLMGGLPLLYAIPHLWKVYARGEIEAAAPFHVRATGSALISLKALTQTGRKRDMTDSLEQLADLHKSGQLSDFEYAKAKDKVIREAEA